MTTITRRQVEILRIVFAAKRPNLRAIADKLHSPNRLSSDLVELIQKRYLHMEREGQEHIYTITTPGRRFLLKHEADTADASIATIASSGQIEAMKEEIDHLEFAIQMLQDASGIRIERPKARVESKDRPSR